MSTNGAKATGTLLAEKQVSDLIAETSHRFDGLHAANAVFDQLTEKVGFANGQVDATTWRGLSDDDRRGVAIAVESIATSLKGVTPASLTVARTSFVVFFLLLLAVAGTYTYTHAASEANPLNPSRILMLAEHMRNIETNARTFVEKRNAQADESDAGKKAALEQQALDAAADVRTRVDGLSKDAEGVNLSVGALQLIATMRSDADTNSLTEDVVSRFTKVLTADLESIRSGFLWNDDRGRWIEFAWWAEMGALVSIVFYIARQRKEGTFTASDTFSFWTEALMAPIVVVAIFFLFAFVGISGISTTDTPIAGLAGFAFMFGYSIRRTLALIDNLKNRFLPSG